MIGRSFAFVLLFQVLASLVTAVIPTTGENNDKINNERSRVSDINDGLQRQPLYMDIEWVMQGWKFGFQGFYVEFLGYSSAFKTLMPNLRIVQSSFRKTYYDSPVDNITQFYRVDMLAQEGEDAFWLQESNISFAPGGGYPKPRAMFLPPSSEIDHDVCGLTSETIDEISNIPGGGSNLFLMNGDLARGTAFDVESKKRCCQLCVQSPLCIGWTYHQASQICKLKGSKSLQLSREGFESGMLTGPPMKRHPVPRAVIFHGTSCFHNNVTFNRMDMGTIFVGRFMVERESFLHGKNIDELSVLSCATKLDEIWVPTMWHYHVLRAELQKLGFPNPQIYVIPEAVDTKLFDPVVVRERERRKALEEGGAQLELSETANSMVIDIDGTVKQALRQVKSTTFQFLSIFKWERRKGWDLLLRAYWSAFSKTDNVILRLRTYIPHFAMKGGGDKNITARIAYFANTEFGKELHELAPVEWVAGVSPGRLSEALTREDIQSLVMSADCFVLPTRGEGWGLPIAEAMALEVPVIVTNYSGITAYATEDNAYLIPVDKSLDQEGFSKPDVNVLADLMKKVVFDASPEGNGVAAAKAKNARATMQQFSPEHAVSMMAERLRELAKMRGWEFN